MAECGLFLNLWLSFLIVTIIKVAGHISVITTISIFFDFYDISCVGELKGLLNFVKNQATYSEKGDPCTIQFTITGNVIKIKEDGNCGNHRNMTCYFNDSYDKKRKTKSKK